MGNSKFFTKTYVTGEVLNITEDLGLSNVSINVLSGSCTVQGDYPLGAIPSSAITLSEGRNLTLSSRGPGSPLAGITITPLDPGNVAVVAQP